MSAHVLRRCTATVVSSVMLAVLLASVSQTPSAAAGPAISGRVVTPDGFPVTAEVRVWAFTVPPSGEGLTLRAATSTGTRDDDFGTFHLDVPSTTPVILAFNATGGDRDETFTPLPGSQRWALQYYSDGSAPGKPTPVTSSTPSTELPVVRLEPSGGFFTGKVTNSAGQPVEGASVLTFAKSSPLSSTTKTWEDGTFRAAAFVGQTGLRFSLANQYVTEYWQNKARFADAAHLDGAPGQTLTGLNVKLERPPLRLTRSAKVRGTLAPRRTLKVTDGSWSPKPTRVTYQWQYRSSGNWRTIAKATKNSYRLPSERYGRQYRVKVTAVRVGYLSTTVLSGATKTVKRTSSVSLSASSPSKKTVRLTAKVSVKGAKATGKVVFQCGNGVFYMWSKKGTIRRGKASVTMRPLPSERLTCKATFAATSKVGSSSKTKRVNVK